MSTQLEPEKILSSHEIVQEEALDLHEESFEDFAESEEISYEISEGSSVYYSGTSVFTEGSVSTNFSPEHTEKDIVQDDPLKAVPVEDYPDMFFLMGNNFPKAIHAYEHIRSLIERKKRCPEQEIKILAPEGDYKNGIFFFSIYKGNFYGSAYCHEKTDKSVLNKALATSRYVPVKDQYNLCRLTCLNTNTYKAVETIFSSDDWCMSRDVVMWLPWYCAREVEVNFPNSDVEIRELDMEHADLINELWMENFPGSRELVCDMFDTHYALGLFERDSLLSWALVWYHGGIGIIQTVEEEKGKGYSRPVVEALTKRMGKYLIDVHLKINRGRRRDIAFFSALGFKYAFTSISCESMKNKGDKNSGIKMKIEQFKNDY